MVCIGPFQAIIILTVSPADAGLNIQYLCLVLNGKEILESICLSEGKGAKRGFVRFTCSPMLFFCPYLHSLTLTFLLPHHRHSMRAAD